MGDVMHSHTYGPYYFWRGLKYRGKLVYTAHVIPETAKGTFPAWKLLMPFFKWYLKKVYSFADICIAISPMVEKAIRDLKVKTEIVRIDNPVLLEQWKRSPDLRSRGREILGLEQNAFCVLSVGQVQTRKGCEDFIKIGSQCLNAQFRWVGGRPFGAFTHGLLRINAAIENATPNVKFMGMYSHEDMACIYAAADLFIFPSFTENCPLAPIEAAASGMPVIFRDIPEYKLLYTNPYLKAANNTEFLALINEMMSNSEAYSKGLEISKKLITQFDKKEIRKKLLDVYKTLANDELIYELKEILK